MKKDSDGIYNPSVISELYVAEEAKKLDQEDGNKIVLLPFYIEY